MEAAVAAVNSDRIVFLEVGPQRTLVNLASQILGKRQLNWVKYVGLAGRDRTSESRDAVETCLKEISVSVGPRQACLWNHK